ncbi:histone-lysine N-trimethyltransferase SMYD5 [Atheta coriaria]|uniref:histone-lysine N-trimethyltransferase SMYD5 n=1 Tax=Dalotia coriaria TaxID=877792 RepID=UPI0031F469F8
MSVEIRHIDPSKGNGLFAKRQIKSGETIFEENPLVSAQFSWNAAYGYNACDHCLRPLETAEENVRRLSAKPNIVLPHPECCETNKTTITACPSCGINYCSPECQQTAFKQYHQTLCCQGEGEKHPLQILNEFWKQCHYPPETSTVMLIPRIIAMIQQSPTKDETLQSFLKFVHKHTNEEDQFVHKMFAEKFESGIDTLCEMTRNAVPNEGVEQLLTPDGYRSMLALIGTNGQGVGTSAISRWAHNVMVLSVSDEDKCKLDKLIDDLYDAMDAHAGVFLNNEGVALYSLQSTCNHSCNPNAEPTFVHNNNRLSLVALKDIEEGDEICISYLDECTLERSRHSRQKNLKENYLFLCACEKCLEEADQPEISTDEEVDMEENEDMSD